MTTSPHIPARVSRCLEAGSVEALFPVLRDWSRSELLTLVDDIEAFHASAQSALEQGYRKSIFRPEVFLDGTSFDRVEQGYKDAHARLLGILSEISSVAQFYLERMEAIK